MALIQCPECGKEISDKAASCLHCGNPMGNQPFPQMPVTQSHSEAEQNREPKPVVFGEEYCEEQYREEEEKRPLKGMGVFGIVLCVGLLFFLFIPNALWEVILGEVIFGLIFYFPVLLFTATEMMFFFVPDKQIRGQCAVRDAEISIFKPYPPNLRKIQVFTRLPGYAQSAGRSLAIKDKSM